MYFSGCAAVHFLLLMLVQVFLGVLRFYGTVYMTEWKNAIGFLLGSCFQLFYMCSFNVTNVI